MSNINVRPKQTTAFYAQAAISFAVSLSAVVIGILYMPGEAWVRGFFTLGILYTVTSSFTLAKCIRDAQETSTVLSRVDEARLEKFMAQYDPLKSTI